MNNLTPEEIAKKIVSIASNQFFVDDIERPSLPSCLYQDIVKAIRTERAVADELRKELENHKMISAYQRMKDEADTLRTFVKKAVEVLINCNNTFYGISGEFVEVRAGCGEICRAIDAILTDPMAKELTGEKL